MENNSVYRSSRVVKQLKAMTEGGLTSVEETCLSLVPPLGRRSILDIGVGAGRTTGALSKMFEVYVGIDYSDKLIAEAQALFPNTDLRMIDARELQFSEQFDCVMFSFNGIDYVDFAERQLILRQIAGVLRPGGYFIYSTHNLKWSRSEAFLRRLLVKELFRPLPRFHTVARSIGNRLRNFWSQSSSQPQLYAYINDPAADFRLLTTYVHIGAEIETLATYGLSVVATIGHSKKTIGYDEGDSWVYVVAERG